MRALAVMLFLLSCTCFASEPPPAEETPPTEVPEPEPEDVPSQTLSLKAVGLWLTSNPLAAPPGALSTADNVALRRAGVTESRRGQAPDAEAPGDASILSLAAFEGGVVAHTSANQVALRDDSTTLTAYSGTYTAPTGHKVRFAEAGGGLYFTTNAGPYRLDSLTSTPTFAGVPPGLEGSGATTGASGWLATTYVVGYRLVWGRRDGDGAVLLGAPSGRILVVNSSGGTRDVAVTAPIPDGVEAGVHFLQVYRTVREAVVSPIDPGEDYAQVAEVFPTAAEIAAGSMTFTDIASFANGPAAYFSQNTGGGTLDSKQQPPLLTDMVNFKGYAFGVVQAYRQELQLTLLAVGGTDGINTGDGLNIIAGATTEGFVGGAAEVPGSNQFLVSTGGTAAQNIEDTARSLVRVINISDISTLIYATYASGESDLPGKIILTARDLDTAEIVIQSSGRGIAEPSPWVPALVQPFAGSAARVSNVVTVTLLSSAGLAAGDVVHAFIDSADPSFVDVTTTIASVPGPTTFTFASVGPDDTNASLQFSFQQTTDVTFTQEATPGSWAHTAYEEPDAWPPRFRSQIGGPNTTLYRIIPQGEALLFWTSTGLYRLTGTDELDFTLRPVDETIRLVGPNTVVSMGNKAYALTDQGVVSVSDLGVEKVSTPIDTALLPFYSGSEALRTLAESSGFGVAYESENEYLLFLPSLEADEGDPADQAYVFNAQTGAWARWVFLWSAVSGATGWVNAALVPPDGRLYVASGDRLSRERKDRILADYIEPGGGGVPVDVAYQVQTAENAALSKNWVEVTHMLEAAQPASVYVYFTTEIDSNEEGGNIASRGNLAVRTYVPLDKSRSARLTAGIRHSTASERLSLLGLSVIYNTGSQRLGR